jgi:hypothetical protein
LPCSECKNSALVRVFRALESRWPNIANYYYSHGEGQATDASRWGVLKVKVIVVHKCESGFTHISGVFHDIGDSKSVCEAELSSIAVLLRLQGHRAAGCSEDSTLLFSTNSLPSWKTIALFIKPNIWGLILARNQLVVCNNVERGLGSIYVQVY